MIMLYLNADAFLLQDMYLNADAFLPQDVLSDGI